MGLSGVTFSAKYNTDFVNENSNLISSSRFWLTWTHLENEMYFDLSSDYFARGDDRPMSVQDDRRATPAVAAVPFGDDHDGALFGNGWAISHIALCRKAV